MIKVINSSELKTENVDLVCSACGRDHGEHVNGKWMYEEGVDYVFETKDGEEWCICLDCKEKFDNQEVSQ